MKKLSSDAASLFKASIDFERTAGDITCSKFAELDSDDRMSVIYDMLDEHDRAKLDPGNLAGISSAIISYCGVGASKHPNEPINNAVAWESDTR